MNKNPKNRKKTSAKLPSFAIIFLNCKEGNLKLNISDPYFSYSCTDPNSGTDGNNGSGFQCVATNLTNNNFKLTVNGGTAASPQFIVVPGGNGCTIGSTASCNPSCVDVLNPSYCPSAAN